MSDLIKDGTGGGYFAKVTELNRLAVEAVTITGEDDAIRVGEGWQISSKPVVFTSSAASAILYVKNTDARNFVLDRAVLILGYASGAGAAENWTFRVMRNPEESGTIVSNALAAGISNSNHGSSKQPAGLLYRGVQGDTVDLAGIAGGAPLPIQQESNRTVYPLGRQLPTGTSIAFQLTPPASTTSATAVLVTHWYYDVAGL
jgi:hypothetical protein